MPGNRSLNQDQTLGLSFPSSCHLCDGENRSTSVAKAEFESFHEPRPHIVKFLTGDGRRTAAKHQRYALPAGQRYGNFTNVSSAVGVESLDDNDAKTKPEMQRLLASASTSAQPQAVNNMCGLYAALRSGNKLDHLECHAVDSAAECADACKQDKWCSSYIHHPKLPADFGARLAVRFPSAHGKLPSAQYFLCQQDPYTDLSEELVVDDWQGQCCLRSDDKFVPFDAIGARTYFDETFPHVTSATLMGNHAADAMLRLPMPDAPPHAQGDYLSAAPNDPVDEQPHSAEAIRHANAVEYKQYGTVWAVARKQCQRKGMDLCPPTSYCKNGKATRMIRSVVKADWYGVDYSGYDWNDEDPAASARTNASAMWMPTLRSCNSWINLHTCEEPDGANPGDAPYMAVLRSPQVAIGCCSPSEEDTETETAKELEEEHARRAFLARPNNRNFILNSLDAAAVRKQMAKRGRPAVLRIVVNAATHGLFAAFQWVMITMRFAKAAGLRSYVDHGPCTVCGHAPFTQDYSYHDWKAGPNAWTYFWKPVDTLRDLMAKPANHSVDVLTLNTQQIWDLYGMQPFDIQSFQKGDFSGLGLFGPTAGVGGPVKFDAPWWAEQRSRAWQLVGSTESNKPIRFSQGFAAYEQKKWDALLAKSAHNGTLRAQRGEKPKLIAAHMRGTDKQCDIGGPKIPAKSHFPIIDAFLTQHPGSLVFVATDAPSTAQMMQQRYGNRLLLEEVVRSEKNALHEHGKHYEGYAWGKAAGAMLDAAHLSRADFLLCANSALGEAAVWLNPKLADNMYNLQFTLREQRKPHHDALFGSVKQLDDLVRGYSPSYCG